MTIESDQALACLLSAAQVHGVPITDEMAEQLPPHAQAKFANHGVDATAAMLKDVGRENPTPQSKAITKLSDEMGIVPQWMIENSHPSTVLGEDFVKPLIDATTQHQMRGGDWEDYKANVVPVAKELQSRIQDTFGNDNKRLAFANAYVEQAIAGGRQYHPLLGENAIMRMVHTRVGNLVAYNPLISTLHLFQMVPKSIGMYGGLDTLKGLTEFGSKFIQSGFKSRIPELENAALYDEHPRPEVWLEKKIPNVTPILDKLHQFDPLQHADNISRGMSYYTGKAAGIDPLKAVQDLVYHSRPGDECMNEWNPANAQSVYLMRFALGGMKMYGGWWNNIMMGLKEGDLAKAAKGAQAVLAFSVAQSVFTGTKSAIPYPIWHLAMNQNQRDNVQAFDDAQPFVNILKKGTGGAVDFSKEFQPLGGIAFGAGFQMVNESLRGTSSNLSHLQQDWTNEDYKAAAVHTVKGIFSPLQLLVPGASDLIKKSLDVGGDVYMGQTAPNEAPHELGQKFHFLPKGG